MARIQIGELLIAQRLAQIDAGDDRADGRRQPVGGDGLIALAGRNGWLRIGGHRNLNKGTDVTKQLCCGLLSGIASSHEIERDVDDHVFLAADHATPAELDQDGASVEAVRRRGLLGVPQEGGIDAGITERQRFAIDAHRAVLQRAHQVFRRVHQLEQIAAVLPSVNIGGGDEHFQRRIARARAHAGEAGIDADRAVLHRRGWSWRRRGDRL